MRELKLLIIRKNGFMGKTHEFLVIGIFRKNRAEDTLEGRFGNQRIFQHSAGNGRGIAVHDSVELLYDSG
ncbi:hypothetical protein SDC9_125635 [bioreactor metagenome]|uniref:Uncharacterized protein n=1 Tax=bioreactor metagenome TaxID=1076179 RepID=A0A645CP19_9ZZZZ